MILITGATSFVGRAVIQRLACAECPIACLLRPSRREQTLPTGISACAVSASMHDLPALRTAMQKVTAIVHLSGEEDIDYNDKLQGHVEDTANLLAAAQEAGVRRIVYLSRLGADRSSAYPIYHTFGEVETMIRASDLDYTILQAPIVYGPGDHFTTTLVMLAKMIPLALPIPAAGMARFQPLGVADLSMCILRTLEQERLVRQTIPLGGPEHFTFEQMVTEVLTAANVQKRLLKTRVPFIEWEIAIAHALLPRNPTPYWWLDLLATGCATDLMTVPRHFDFEPVRLADNLDYLRQKRPWRRDFLRFILRRTT
jgi:NADH dehydrogenase